MHALAIIVYNGSKCMRSQSMHAVAAHWLQSQNSRACHGRTNTPPAARACSATRIRIPGKSDLDIDMRLRPAQAREAALAVTADEWNRDQRCNCMALAANAAGAGPRDRPCMQWEPKARNRMHWLRLQAIAANACNCSRRVQVQQRHAIAVNACNCRQCMQLQSMHAIAAHACHCGQCAAQ